MTYLMNPETGTVASHEESALLEVVENVEGQEGYDPEYGDWRPADDDLPANSASDDSGDLDQWDPEICPECQGEDFNLIDTYTAYASDLDYDDPDVEPDTVFTILRFACECGCDFKVIEETNEVVSISHLD